MRGGGEGGGDRYIFCGPMFVSAFVLSQPNFKVKQEAPRSIMGRCASGVNLLAFSVAMLSQRSHRGKLPHWAKCLHLGVSQVVSECTSGLNGLIGLLAGSKQSLEI